MVTFKMKELEQIAEFKTSPELVEKLLQHSIRKEYKAGSLIVNENAHIRSIPIVTKGTLKLSGQKKMVEKFYYIILKQAKVVLCHS